MQAKCTTKLGIFMPDLNSLFNNEIKFETYIVKN
jgi:hypothetical protein